MTPTDIKLHKKSGLLELKYEDGSSYSLPAELLRVYSPSAEVRGHGQGQEVLQTGKLHVKITSIDMVGNYAIRLHFDDDHSTGIYTWDYLHELGVNQQPMWTDYMKRMLAAGASREPPRDPAVQIVNIMPLKH
jgi:DUF971 family protein